MDEREIIGKIIEFGAANNYEIIFENTDDDATVDFININLKSNKIYIGELNVDEDLTDVG